ncbi:hypothetical protein CIK05_13900 [Bdellovibrio sp. qaytius]|nr:hypothetical protein CIK05_13900 [Bdellovibrio sp. qaytius]
MKLNQGSMKAIAMTLMTLMMVGCDKSDKPYLAAGPGAALSCASSGKNAWETYGVNAFVAVNERIFTNVGAELGASGTANLGGSFQGGAVVTPEFKGNLAAFLVYVYGGPYEITYTDNVKYYGPQDMTQKHTGLAITGAQYDYFVSNIVVPALTVNGVPGGDVSSCFAPPLVDAAFKASVVGH